VLVRVAEDERFVREGHDLISHLTLSAPDAALGVTRQIQTLDGPEEIVIDPGAQPGTVITLPGKGMPSLRRGERGDQRVVLDVVVPTRLSREQEDMLRRFRDTLTEDYLRRGEDEGSFFRRIRRAFR
jgi:molecular chaperone DnaJ